MTVLRRVLFAVAILILGCMACGPSAKEIKRSKTSAYNADFAVVYNAALAAVRKSYPRLMENARLGVIETGWHQVKFDQKSNEDNRTLQERESERGLSGTSTMTRSHARHWFFIRFTVRVEGGRPWKISVEGEASEQKEGALPVPLQGGDEPHWLKGRTNALRVAMYQKLAKYAVKIKVKKKKKKKKVVANTTLFGNLPSAAALMVTKVMDAAQKRDFQTLESFMTESFLWSVGAPESRFIAIAAWKADERVVLEMVALLRSGCDMHADQIHCQVAGRGPKAVFKKLATGWHLISFVR